MGWTFAPSTTSCIDRGAGKAEREREGGNAWGNEKEMEKDEKRR